MGEYKDSIMVLVLLVICFLTVIYFCIYKRNVIPKESNYSDSNYNDYGESYYSDNNYNEEPYNLDNSYYDNEANNNLNNYAEDITSDEPKEESIFDVDFSRNNPKTEPDITETNALKLGRWEDDDYIIDKLGIKIKLLPGWSLSDFGSSFHISEGSGQVNTGVFKLFRGNEEEYLEIIKESNERIFDTVFQTTESIGNTTYTVLTCRYDNKDYFERKVYITNTKLDNINISIETDFYNTKAPFTTRNYSLSDIFEKID